MPDYDNGYDVQRANEIVERLNKNPRIAQIVADARLFDTLRQDPAWRRLFDAVTQDRERVFARITKRLFGPRKNWPEPEEVAYYRGFYAGAIFVLSHPEHAEKNLEQAATVAWAMYGDDLQDEEAQA